MANNGTILHPIQRCPKPCADGASVQEWNKWWHEMRKFLDVELHRAWEAGRAIGQEEVRERVKYMMRSL